MHCTARCAGVYGAGCMDGRCRVQCAGLKAHGAGSAVKGAGCKGGNCRVQGAGGREQGSMCRVYGCRLLQIRGKGEWCSIAARPF